MIQILAAGRFNDTCVGAPNFVDSIHDHSPFNHRHYLFHHLRRLTCSWSESALSQRPADSGKIRCKSGITGSHFSSFIQAWTERDFEHRLPRGVSSVFHDRIDGRVFRIQNLMEDEPNLKQNLIYNRGVVSLSNWWALGCWAMISRTTFRWRLWSSSGSVAYVDLSVPLMANVFG